MVVEAQIRARDFQLTLRADRYERPADTTGSDANWLVGAVELTVGSMGRFSASLPVSLFTSDLERFAADLRVLDRELTGAAALHHIESQLALTIELAAGTGKLSGFVREHIGAKLGFEGIAVDQTYVREALGQFDALVAAFPVRGNPAD
jgi:hypothetical protein